MSRDDRAEPVGRDRTVDLLLACLRPLAAGDRVAAIAAAADAGFDPARLVALAHRHRVVGFVAEGLAAAGVALPPAIADRLADAARTARVRSLRLAAEEMRVGRALAAGGIDALFLKGATLAMRAHGTLGLKTSWDIDVLVPRERMAAAGDVLAALGYRLSILGGVTDPAQVRRFLAAHKEAEWRDEATGIVVELHTELADNRAAIPTIGLGSPRQRVAFASGDALETLATAPLFAYLAYHGTSHLWARLKWLADVAALLHGEDGQALHRAAVALGAGRTPGVAIVLAHDLLGLAVSPALLAEIGRDRATRRLLRYARAAIAAPQTADGVLMQPFRELAAYARAQAWLAPGLAHRWGAVRRFLTRPYLPAHLRVPGWAAPIAILGILPGRLVLRRSRLRRHAAGGTAGPR